LFHFSEAISDDGHEKNLSEEVEQAVQTPSSSDSSTRDTVGAGTGEAATNPDQGTLIYYLHHVIIIKFVNVMYIVMCVCCIPCSGLFK